MGRRGRLAGGALCVLLLAGCSQERTVESPAFDSVQGQVHPVSGLALRNVVVDTGDARHRFVAELAETREEQAKGLMYRTELGPDEAMIFPSEPPTARSFWMKNTPIPLDIIFIGTDGRILNIAAMTEPYSLESVYSTGSTSGVLELRGGRAAELGIEPGDLVTW